MLAVICSRLQDLGLSTISTASYEASAASDDDANGGGSVVILTILPQEGYVVIRANTHHQYCAIGLHFWSRFDLQQAAEVAMANSLHGDDKQKCSSPFPPTT